MVNLFPTRPRLLREEKLYASRAFSDIKFFGFRSLISCQATRATWAPLCSKAAGAAAPTVAPRYPRRPGVLCIWTRTKLEVKPYMKGGPCAGASGGCSCSWTPPPSCPPRSSTRPLPPAVSPPAPACVKPCSSKAPLVERFTHCVAAIAVALTVTIA